MAFQGGGLSRGSTATPARDELEDAAQGRRLTFRYWVQNFGRHGLGS